MGDPCPVLSYTREPIGHGHDVLSFWTAADCFDPNYAYEHSTKCRFCSQVNDSSSRLRSPVSRDSVVSRAVLFNSTPHIFRFSSSIWAVRPSDSRSTSSNCPESVVILSVADLNMPLPLALAWRRDNTSPLLNRFVDDVRQIPEVHALNRS